MCPEVALCVLYAMVGVVLGGMVLGYTCLCLLEVPWSETYESALSLLSRRSAVVEEATSTYGSV
jgi:hypothetical protein